MEISADRNCVDLALAFEICEIDKATPFYDNVIKEGIKIA